MATRLQQTTETRQQYLRAALRYCRKQFNRLRETPEYRSCHSSFPACEAMRLTEERFTDLGTFGTEGFCWTTQNGLTYLNTGETYELTICYRSDSRRFFIDSYGDFVERNPELTSGCDY